MAKKVNPISRKESEVNPMLNPMFKELYKIHPIYANGVYITNIIQDNSALARIVFTEHSLDLNQDFPVGCIIVTVEDLARINQAISLVIQQLLVLGKGEKRG